MTRAKLYTVAKLIYDCHVTAVCSAKNVEYVKKLGADAVVDYTSQDVVTALASTKEKYDLVVDCVGGNLYNYFYPIIQRRGAYVTLVGNHTDVRGKHPSALPYQIFKRAQSSKCSGTIRTPFIHTRDFLSRQP